MQRPILSLLILFFTFSVNLAHASDSVTITFLFKDTAGNPLDMSWEEEIEWLDTVFGASQDHCNEISRTFLRYGEEVPWFDSTRTEEFSHRTCLPKRDYVSAKADYDRRSSLLELIFSLEDPSRATAKVDRGSVVEVTIAEKMYGWAKPEEGNYYRRTFETQGDLNRSFVARSNLTVKVVLREILTVPTEVYLPLTGRFTLTSGAEQITIESKNLAIPSSTWTLGWSPTAPGYDVREPKPPEDTLVLVDDKVVTLGEQITFKPGESFQHSITVRKPRKVIDEPLLPREPRDVVCWPELWKRSWIEGGYRMIEVEGRCVIQWWENPPPEKPWISKGPRESDPFDHISLYDVERIVPHTWDRQEPPAVIPYYTGIMGTLQSSWPRANSRATYFRGSKPISKTHSSIRTPYTLPRNPTTFLGWDVAQKEDGTWEDRIWVYAQDRSWGPYQAARLPEIGSDEKAVFPAQLLEDGLWHMIWGDEVGPVGYTNDIYVRFAGRAATDNDPAYPPTFNVTCGNATYAMPWDDQHACGEDIIPEEDIHVDLDDLLHSPQRPRKKRR